MELRHLRYFVAVAEELNFRRASQRLCIEQPPLSRQIQQLEAEIGVLLFARVRRHVELTPGGHVFLEEARLTLAQADLAVQAARQASRRQEFNICVCFCLGKYSYAFDRAYAQAVRALRDRHPGLRLNLMELDSAEQERALSGGRVDVGFIQTPVTSLTLISQSILQEPLVLALPQEHPLASQLEVPLGSLGQENLFLFPEDSHPTLHQAILASCKQAGFRPKSVQEKTSPQNALWLVGAGLGVSFVGASFVEMKPPGIAFRPVPDFPHTLEYSVTWRRDSTWEIVTEFVALAKVQIKMPD